MENIVINQFPISLLEEVKKFNNKKLGVTVKEFPCFMGGCCQSKWKRVTVSITDYCIGRTCAGSDYFDNEIKVKSFLKPFQI